MGVVPGDVAAGVPVLDAPGVVGLAVTGAPGVLDVLDVLDDEQPAAAATQMSAAAATPTRPVAERPVAERPVAARPVQKSAIPELLGLDNIGVPFIRAAPHAPFSC